jgi:hypothetical protein
MKRTCFYCGHKARFYAEAPAGRDDIDLCGTHARSFARWTKAPVYERRVEAVAK